MIPASLRPALILLACLATASRVVPVSAQEPSPAPTDEQRREEAREEQDEARRQEQAAAEGEAEAAERQAEAERLDALGVPEGSLFEEDRGFLIALEAWLPEAGGADRPVARVGEILSAAGSSEALDTDSDGLPDAFTIGPQRTLELAYDSEVAPQVELGWRNGRGGAISARWWTMSQDSDAAATATTTFLPSAGGMPLILGGIDSVGRENDAAAGIPEEAYERPFGFAEIHVANRLHGADSVVSTGSLELSRLDLLYSNVGIVRRRFDLGWRAGLTLASAERDSDATFTWKSFPGAQVAAEAVSVETVSESTETDALGATVGGAARVALTLDRRFALRLGVDVSGLRADQVTRYRSGQVFSQVPLGPQPEQVFQDLHEENGSRPVTILDAQLAFEGRFGQHVQVAAGYRHATWMGVLTQAAFTDPSNPARLVLDEQDVDLSGPYVRISFGF